jgi:Na+-driven multidrug efflux pump
MGEERSTMEETLLAKVHIDSKTENDEEEEEQRKKRLISWDIYTKELKRICHISGPMVAVVLSQYLLQVVSTMIVGHLGELYLSSAALSISFTGVTGFSFLVCIFYYHTVLLL